MATDTQAEIVPLSAFAGLREFACLLLYQDRPGRDERAGGDWKLLALLDEQLRARLGDAPTVGSLPKATVQGCIETVESELYGRWKLAGDSDAQVIDRLDEHFAPMQQAHARLRAQQDEQAARIGAEARKLDVQLGEQRRREDIQLWGLERLD